MPGPASAGGANVSLLLSSEDVQPRCLHIVRVAGALPPTPDPSITTFTVPTPTSTSYGGLQLDWDDHHEWAAPPPSLAPQEAEDAALTDGAIFIVRPPGFFGGEEGTRIQAWRGPDWEAGARYVAVVVLEDGRRVRSEERELQVVH
jgi:hypothetical protein